MFNEKKVNLYIDDTSIRILETAGKRMKKWGELALEPGLVKAGVVVNESEVALRIRQLLKSQNVKAKKVVLCLSGLHSLSRPIVLPRLPKSMLAEAVIREARRVLPIPLDQLYLSWQLIPGAEEKLKVFLVAIPRKTGDSLVRTLQGAGLEPYCMTLKPMALARATREKTAILLDTQSAEFDIAIISDGLAHPVRTISLPEETKSWQEKLPMIISDLDRTIKFYNDNNKEKPLGNDVTIYVSGDLINMPELHKIISEALGHPVSLLGTSVDIPHELDIGRYMTNIALTIKGSINTFFTPDINVLPAPYQPKPISIGRIVVAPATVFTMLLLAPLVILIQTTSANSVSLNDEINTVNRMVALKQHEKQELNKAISELGKDITATKSSGAAISSAASSIRKQQEWVEGNLKTAIKAVSSTDVSLTEISQSADELTIGGRAASDLDVLSYARSLNMSGRFSEVVIASIRRVSGEMVDFTLVLKIEG